MKKIIHTQAAPVPLGPYSQAVKAGDFLFVSGQVGINPAVGKIDAENIQDETKQVFKNIEAILKEAGMELSDIIKATIFVTDLGDFSAVNEVYATFFKKDFPARETAQACKLPAGAKLEISVVAFKS
ncbi:MAG: Rid family detoxifying hydrolase [Bacteroidota bacterium]